MISEIKHIERGYEAPEKVLGMLSAKIKRTGTGENVDEQE